jgi:hypothetical protein
MSRHALLFALLAAVLVAGRQPARADSIFSSRALGLPVVGADGRSWAMGGVTMALGGESFSSTNPALRAHFSRSGFTGMIIPEYRRPEDALGRANLRGYSVPEIAIVLPIPKRLVASGEIVQELDMNWRFDSEREYSGETLQEYLESDGSLYAFSLGVARPFGRHLALGAGIEFHRGESERTWILGASPGTPGFGSSDVVKNTYSGESVKLGVLYHALSWLDLGFSIRPGYTLSRDERLEAGTGYTEVTHSRVEMPSTIGAGCSLTRGKFTAGFDIESTPYGDTRFTAPSGFAMQDYTRLSAGIELTPSRDPFAPFWKRMPLRAGFMWRRLPSVLEGRGISEKSFLAGTGIALGSGVGRMDFFTQLTSRGSLEEVGFSERVLRFGIAVSGFEKWLPKRKGRPI